MLRNALAMLVLSVTALIYSIPKQSLHLTGKPLRK
jgi:hypothetical protein